MQESRINELLNLMRNGKSENERIMAALDLGEAQGERIVEALVGQLEVETSRAVQEAIISSLIKIRDRCVAESVAELLKSEDAYIRNAGVEILALIGDSALDVLEKMIKHPDKDVRQQAVVALGEGRLKAAPALLKRVIEEDEDENVVAAAIEYLGEIGCGKEDGEAIKRAARRFSSPFFDYTVKTAIGKLME
ncbi:HEAT repeat domain-containing protein [Thermoanaerobacterium sp. DL9XJH110]|uniref:HEAT repeat domain-containing protein n=1 Tax=Thermoanaerobacterium sp. DL9XJH110 TaxID=3386643 RepID=UPI003BB7BE7D